MFWDFFIGFGKQLLNWMYSQSIFKIKTLHRLKVLKFEGLRGNSW